MEMAVGKKEFLSLVVLHFTLLYLRPEGKSVNSPCWAVLMILFLSLPLSAGVCGPWQWHCRTTQWCNWSRCSQQRSCSNSRWSQLTCETSWASLKNTAAVEPSSPSLWCSLSRWGPRWCAPPGIWRYLPSSPQALGWIVADEVSSSSSCP